MVIDCQILCLSQLSEHDYREINPVEYDFVANNYRNAHELDEASLYVLYVAHRTFLQKGVSWKSFNYFLTMSFVKGDKSKVERFVFVVGEDQKGNKRFNVITRDLSMSIEQLRLKFCDAIDFNNILLDMEIVKNYMDLVLVASLDSDFTLNERFIFDACSHFNELGEMLGSNPKIYNRIGGLCINHERMLSHMHGKRRKSSFMSGGKRYHVFCG